VAGRIISMKNSNDTIRNRIRDLPACVAVPQPTTPPCAPLCIKCMKLIIKYFLSGDISVLGGNLRFG